MDSSSGHHSNTNKFNKYSLKRDYSDKQETKTLLKLQPVEGVPVRTSTEEFAMLKNN